MKLFAIAVGALAGLFFTAAGPTTLFAAISGGLLGLMWFSLSDLRKQLNRLESQLKLSPPPKTAATIAAPQKAATPPPATSLSGEFQFELATAPAAQNSARTPFQASAEAPARRSAPTELWDILKTYLTGGNVVVKVGVVVLFFGVAFLLKYSAERNFIPIELRLTGVGMAAIALQIFGWRLRLRRPAYAVAVQGAAVGIFYLTLFAAIRLYHLLPAGVVFPLLVGLSIFSAILAIRQEARSLAVIGILGGFLAPLLTSTGAGSHVMLLSYFAFLNGGILFTAWYRSWRELNLLGFVFTFGISALWGSQNYQAALFASTEPFLVLFFLFYFAIGILFASRQPLNLKGYIDGTLVFGTPIVCFGLQATLVAPYEYGLAWSALAMGLLYAGTAWQLYRRGNTALRTLVEAFLATGVVLGTVAIPLALDGRWTSAAWALEGAAIIWIALKKRRWLPRLFGLVLQFLGGYAFLLATTGSKAQFPLVNSIFLGCLAIAVAALFSGACLYRNRTQGDSLRAESVIALGWGLAWWFGAGLQEIDFFVRQDFRLASSLSFLALSALGTFFLGSRLGWKDMRQIYKGLLPVMILTFFANLLFQGQAHPLRGGGIIAWPLAFAVLYVLLRRDSEDSRSHIAGYFHLGALLLLITLTTWEIAWWTNRLVGGAEVWPLVTGGLVPAIFVLALSRQWRTRGWPLADFRETYLVHALTPVVFVLWVGSIGIHLFSRGHAHPLPYIPLLNPLDLAQAFVLLAILYWNHILVGRLGVLPFDLNRATRLALFGGTVFYWLNAVLIRTLHHWGGIRFNARAMAASELVQTSLSIFWTLAALLIMLWSAKKGLRRGWMAGAGLLGTVILKLFVVDLANTSTVERIVSFIGVGVICLLIGYLAPLPAQDQKEAPSP